MTDRDNSNVSSDGEAAWSPEWIFNGRTSALNNPLDERVKNMLELPGDRIKSDVEEDPPLVEERPEDEIVEEIVRNFLTIRGNQKGSLPQNETSYNRTQNSRQILLENTNSSLLPEQGHERNYCSQIQENEFAEENLTEYKLNYSTFHCPICSYRSVDRSQVQKHFHALHEENTTSSTFESSMGESFFDEIFSPVVDCVEGNRSYESNGTLFIDNDLLNENVDGHSTLGQDVQSGMSAEVYIAKSFGGRSNSYIDDNHHDGGEFSEEFMGNIAQSCIAIIETNQAYLNFEAKCIFVDEIEKSDRPPTKSTNVTPCSEEKNTPLSSQNND